MTHSPRYPERVSLGQQQRHGGCTLYLLVTDRTVHFLQNVHKWFVFGYGAVQPRKAVNYTNSLFPRFGVRRARSGCSDNHSGYNGMLSGCHRGFKVQDLKRLGAIDLCGKINCFVKAIALRGSRQQNWPKPQNSHRGKAPVLNSRNARVHNGLCHPRPPGSTASLRPAISSDWPS